MPPAREALTRAAPWAIAIGVVVAWNVFDGSNKPPAEKAEEFSADEARRKNSHVQLPKNMKAPPKK